MRKRITALLFLVVAGGATAAYGHSRYDLPSTTPPSKYGVQAKKTKKLKVQMYEVRFRNTPFDRALALLADNYGLEYTLVNDCGGLAVAAQTSSSTSKVSVGGATPSSPPTPSACSYSTPVNLTLKTLSLDELVNKLCEVADYYCEKNPKGWWEIRHYQTAKIEFPSLYSTTVVAASSTSGKSSYTYDDSFFVKQVLYLLSPEGRLIRSGAGFVVVKDRPSFVKRIVRIMNYQKEHTQPLKLTIKVLRIDLNKDREAGIDWNAVLHKAGGILTASSSYATNSITGNAFSFTLNRSNLSTLLKVLEQYGKVNTVKEWTTITIAGKPLYTNSVEKVPWFQRSITQNAQTAEVATQVNFEEVGLKINVLPEVVEDDTLKGSLYAEVSSLLGYEESQNGDKAPRTALSNAFVNFSIPFGSVLVVSGLKEKQEERGHAGIPVLSSLPVVGSLFGWQYKREKSSEIVVIVAPTPIVEGE